MNKFEKISENQYSIDTENFNAVAYESIKLPHRATKHSAGYDIYSTLDFTLNPGDSIKLPTGIKVSLDNNKFLMILPRSSLGFNYRLHLDNTAGIIDADYYNNPNNEGHFWIKLTNDSRDGNILNVRKGDSIAQGIILEYTIVADDNTDEIRSGGLGSTTKL